MMGSDTSRVGFCGTCYYGANRMIFYYDWKIATSMLYKKASRELSSDGDHQKRPIRELLKQCAGL